jgi:transposase
MVKNVSEDLKCAMIRMKADNLKVVKIAQYCDVSNQTVYNVLKLFRTTGDVVSIATNVKRGRPRKLNECDRDVSNFLAAGTIYD